MEKREKGEEANRGREEKWRESWKRKEEKKEWKWRIGRKEG